MRLVEIARRVQAQPARAVARAAPSRFVYELGRKLSEQKAMSSLARLARVEEKIIDAGLASTEIWRPGQKQWVDRQ